MKLLIALFLAVGMVAQAEVATEGSPAKEQVDSSLAQPALEVPIEEPPQVILPKESPVKETEAAKAVPEKADKKDILPEVPEAGVAKSETSVPIYLYLGVGWAFPSYNGIDGAFVNTLKHDPSVSHVTPYLELPGVYFGLSNRRTLLGLIPSALIDSYFSTGGSLRVSQYSLAFSAIHFFGEKVGEGFYVRGDIGPALGHAVLDLTPSGGNYYTATSFGWGILGGVGWAIPTSSQTHILIGGDVAYRSLFSESIPSFILHCGFLF